MTVVIHDIQQGTAAWFEFRARHFGASEAAAMLGLSSHTSRSALLKEKHTGLAKEHSDWLQARVLDEGHRVEGRIRSHIEEVIGEDLYSVVCSKQGTKLSASCDGLTLAGDIAWECKQWNPELAKSVRGIVPDEHMPQCQQILLVTGAKYVLFTVSDGTPERTVYTPVKPDAKWFDRIERGWAQFEQDLAAYVQPEAAPAAVAAPQESLPVVSVQLQGALTVASNLAPFGVALRAFIERIPKKPSTDQEFADTEAACKRLKEAEDRLGAAEDSALASMADVETMRRMVADFKELARSTRLASEKLVAQRKLQIREDEVKRGATAFAAHTQTLNKRLGGNFMPNMPFNFGIVIKGLKTLDSVRNAIDTELARLKIGASEVADKIDVNIKTINEAIFTLRSPTLFPDRAALVLKSPEDLAATITVRIAEDKARLERIATEQERLKAEEASRVAAAQVSAGVPAIGGVVSPPVAAASDYRQLSPAMQALAPLEARPAYPNPTPTDQADPLFEAIWSAIKTWDIQVPEYDGRGLYAGANGSHVLLILQAVRKVEAFFPF